MPPKGMLSEERVKDSSGDESSASERTQILKQRLSGTAKSASPTQIERISESNSEDSESESDTSSGSSSSKSPSTTQPKRKARPVETSAAESPSKRPKIDYHKTKRIESTTYVPPQGYSTISMKISDTEALDMFDNLEGKQIWHISTPSTMPLSEIESLDVANVLKGAGIWSHKGFFFEMSRTSVGGATLLLPNGRNGDYALSGTAITRAFRIQESSKHKTNESTRESDNNGAGDVNQKINFFATQVGQKMKPRDQPENLKARYVPYGVLIESQDHSPGHSAVVNEDLPTEDGSTEAASQRTPRSVKKTKSKKTFTNDMDVDETPLKRKKDFHTSPLLDGAASQDGSQKKKKKEKNKKNAV